MFCAISGEVPEVPIISAKSGHVFEKRLIEKYIADNGTCPITGQPLTLEDLITVTSDPPVPKPRPPTMSSIPSMLSVFQNEWDSVMLETFTLKQQYQKARQELAHALYQSDASCRVIARLIKERDAARDALANVQAHLAQPSADTNTAAEPQPMATDEAPSAAPQEGMTDGVIETIDSTAEA
ncbi:E3 ubiquitin-protein ligase prp19 [Dimargaris verticillata]|uniref:Pre-mRNA-processing factor 19 n=1 Tax=Dimargaris verticillata TaxID=2761393 RepID=A0A9W8AVP4_9FUNG|nr:E3 ubiquitin-protein ligase prp19 [Dimargaris verticillata]